MGTFILSNWTVSLLLFLLLQGGAFAGKLGISDPGVKNVELKAGDIAPQSRVNDAKDGETVAALPQAAAEGTGPVPAGHAVNSGPEKPAGGAVSGHGDQGKQQPGVVHTPVSAEAQPLAGAELSAGLPAAAGAVSAPGAHGPVLQQQGHQPPQAGAAPDPPQGHEAPKEGPAATSPPEAVETEPPLHPKGALNSPSSAHIAVLGQAPGAGQALGNDLANVGTATHGASQAKGNAATNPPVSQGPTGAPTTKKAGQPTPATTVEPSVPSPAEPSRPSQDKGLLSTKPAKVLLDVAKDSDGIPPPNPVGVADYSHAREPDSEEELEPLAPKEPSSPVLGGAAAVGAQSVAGPAGDGRPEKPLDASGAVGSVSFPPTQDDSHFFAYFLTAVVLCVVGYLAFHNKRKILALILEGRHERQRRHNGHYRRLDNVDDTSSSRKGRGSF